MRSLVASIIFGFSLVSPTQCWADSGKDSSNNEAEPCKRIVKADIVALEQAYLLNRFSAFVPGGMLFALRRDVVSIGHGQERAKAGQLLPGQVSLRADKRPRPLVLRVNEGECLDVTFTNLLSPDAAEEGREPRDYGGRFPAHVGAAPGSGAGNVLARSQPVSVDAPRTRAASFHVTGLERAPMAPEECPLNVACGGDGTNVGLPTQSGLIFNPKTDAATRAGFTLGSLAKPGQTVVTRWQARTEGAYFTYSAAAPVGGEGDGGQIGLGLFGSVNVEPAGSRWFRSQVTHETLRAVTHTGKDARHPYAGIVYDARDKDGAPVLAMLDDSNEIVHSDLNAIIVPPELNKRAGVSEPSGCTDGAFGWECGRPFREFTVIFHDEVHAQQAFAELEDENDPISFLKDGMGINYGVSSMGSLMLATKQFAKGIGPAKDCAECRAEEFFLSSWANGDPALILSYGEDGKPNGARYRDDPSNVHHSYLGDPVRFRNLHAGPKETHVFHLHAHQWMQDGTDKNSTYLDSQTISPGATFSYAVEFGGSGNRNYTPADSIFHCHLYPHFAQGMWELWRVHDAFADGKDAYFDPTKPAGPGNDPTGMNLPDAEIGTGTQTAALVPIPGSALAPMPTEKFRGYPFYIPGEAGHRPPQPALDFDVAGGWPDLTVEPDAAKIVDGGLPRHIVKSGELRDAETKTALATGGQAAQVIAQRVAKQDAKALTLLAKEWTSIEIAPRDERGERAERDAMRFHEGYLDGPGLEPVEASSPHPAYWTTTRAYRTDFAGLPPDPNRGRPEALFHVNAQPRAQGAPFANPCPEGAPLRQYRAAFIQTELTYNKHGWFDPQGRIMVLENDLKDVIDPDNRTKLPEPLFFRANSGECIQYKSTNLIPSALNVDDFQIFTPTDTIGQHIHLVKFDVTSSDGSGNGFNYEDATFSPLEVQERVLTFNRTPVTNPDGTSRPKTAAERLHLKVHPLFQEGGDIFQAAQRDPARFGKLLARGQCPDQQPGQSDEDYKFLLRTEHDFCGAQRTTQRWWADPILNRTTGKDNTLRTVFTHDHLGPSSHQQHGLYAGLVIEPANSVWTRISVEPNGTTELPPERRLSRDEMAAIGDGSGLRCDLSQTGGAANPNDPGQVCRKVIGGSALGLKTATNLLKGDEAKPGNPIEGAVEPRKPLILRGDGGPTASRANIVAPGCIADSDSNELQPDIGRNRAATDAPCRPSKDTRREFELAIADFGIAYNTALEPINPEPRGESTLRDVSALRFGRRHVATALARPLGISSEDPGSQYFNYRHEPVALRIGQGTANAEIGGWDYRQNPLRADGTSPCIVGVHQDCLGDPANALSSPVHALRDERLAKTPLPVVLNPRTRDLLAGTRAAAKLDAVLGSVEAWRRRFNCMLYGKHLMGEAEGCSSDIERPEPGRVFGDPATPLLTAYEGETVQLRLIQGAQEAQHVFTMNAVKWPRLPGDDPDGTEPDAKGSGFVNAQPLGISEHFEFNLDVPRIDGLQIDRLYFGSSTDQLWDGLWGVLRSYPYPRSNADRERVEALFGTRGRVLPRDILAPLPGGMRGGTGTAAEDLSAQPAGGDKKQVCSKARNNTDDRYFDVAVARVCDLLGGCDGATPSGLVYSTRFGIRDENAIAYVLEREGTCSAKSCEDHGDAVSQISNAQALQTLRKHYAAGRRLEPMILRAAAGQCLHVNLRNLLPRTIASDGPVTDADGKPVLGPDGRPAEVPEARAFFNFLPMITDGFNVNQFRMSSSVGLSPAKVTINPIWSDGSNVGLNATSVVDQGQPEPASGDALHRQGSLLPPCTGDPAVDGDEESRCRDSYEWSLAEFAPGGRGKAIEFAAVPLRSFGDPIKHPAHGLVGALVVGPEGSKVCEGDRFAQRVAVPGEETSVVHGTSAEICAADGAKLYADHVLVLQDGVSASRGGLPVPNLSGAEEPDDYGVKAINYRTDPLWARSVNDPSVGFSDRSGQDLSRVLSSAVATDGQTIRCVAGMPPLLARTYPCDPETPILDARPGETLRLSFVHPGGHTRQTGLAVSGHAWSPYPWSRDSRVFRNPAHPSIRQGVFNAFGPMMGVTFELQAGGEHRIPLDYLVRSQASFQFDGGQWGLLRVRKPPVEATVTSP